VLGSAGMVAVGVLVVGGLGGATAGTVTDGVLNDGTVTEGVLSDWTVTDGVLSDGTVTVGRPAALTGAVEALRFDRPRLGETLAPALPAAPTPAPARTPKLSQSGTDPTRMMRLPERCATRVMSTRPPRRFPQGGACAGARSFRTVCLRALPGP